MMDNGVIVGPPACSWCEQRATRRCEHGDPSCETPHCNAEAVNPEVEKAFGGSVWIQRNGVALFILGTLVASIVLAMWSK